MTREEFIELVKKGNFTFYQENDDGTYSFVCNDNVSITMICNDQNGKYEYPIGYPEDLNSHSGDNPELFEMKFFHNGVPIYNENGVCVYTMTNKIIYLPFPVEKNLKFYFKLSDVELFNKILGNPISWSIIEGIIEEEMRGEYVTIVNYVP